LHDYIEEAAGTSLCSVQEPYTGCSKKQETYILKMKDMGSEAILKQYERMSGMTGNKMKKSKKWHNQKIKILRALSKVEPSHDEIEYLKVYN